MIKYFLLLSILMPVLAFAEDARQQPMIGDLLLQNELKTYQRLQEYTNPKLASSSFEDFPMTSDMTDYQYRSPGRSFLYSLIVPGGGQYYTDSKFKAGVFMGIEVLSWAGYFVYHGKGRDQEDKNKAFADGNWDPKQYYEWLIEVHGITSDTMESKLTGERFTHHLPDTKTQQYYEMIGKYDQFQYGWINTDYVGKDSTSAERDGYLIDRDKANKDFDRAKLGAIISLANHLISAFDGALSAKRYNRKQDTFSEFSVRPRLAMLGGKQEAKVTFTYKF